jgi:flavin reductase (DIM6/NTAB) family NADH-FMN oxidoreductase RutF
VGLKVYDKIRFSSVSSNPASSPSPEAFRRACGRFATGVTVVTVMDRQGRPQGFTANSFTSVSLNPPLILVCVDLRARILDFLHEGSVFNINVLRATQRELSVRFATPAEDRFAGVAWSPSAAGAPRLEGALSLLECCVERVLTEGDHVIVVGRVLDVEADEGEPLVYFGGAYRALAPDHPGPTSPTAG